jgi:plasmid stabilization system protein ParE
LADKNPHAARNASAAIRSAFKRLEDQPDIGRPFGDSDTLRELIISFGATGYVALYTHAREKDSVLILAFRHQKEAGY